MEKRDLIQKGEASLLDLRSYLFSRQCTLLIFLQRPWEVTARALELLHNCVQELRLLEVLVSVCSELYSGVIQMGGLMGVAAAGVCGERRAGLLGVSQLSGGAAQDRGLLRPQPTGGQLLSHRGPVDICY